MIKLDYFDWVEKYKPLTDEENLIDFHPRTSTESQKEQWDKARSNNTAWTALDVEGKTIITNGIHWVNRLDYYITELPWEDEEIIEVD